MKQVLFGALAGLVLAVMVIAVANVHLWIGTDYPFMPPMTRLGAIATLVLFPIIGAVLAGSGSAGNGSLVGCVAGARIGVMAATSVEPLGIGPRFSASALPILRSRVGGSRGSDRRGPVPAGTALGGQSRR